MIRISFLSLLFVLLSSVSVFAGPPIWTVRDADSEMILFGSVHALTEETDWRSDEIDRAVAGADVVVFEIIPGEDPEADAAQMERLLVHFLAPPDEPLSSVIPVETNARLQNAIMQLGGPPDGFEHLRPWSAAMGLGIVFDDSLGRTEEQGVDTILQAEVPDDTTLVALDDDVLLERTMIALAATPMEDQIKMLEEALDLVESGEGLDMTLDDAWVEGDLAALGAEIENMRLEHPVIYQALLVDRNVAWMDRLVLLLQTESNILVVVGAGHLVGPDGLPTLLSNAGFSVEGPGFPAEPRP